MNDHVYNGLCRATFHEVSDSCTEAALGTQTVTGTNKPHDTNNVKLFIVYQRYGTAQSNIHILSDLQQYERSFKHSEQLCTQPLTETTKRIQPLSLRVS